MRRSTRRILSLYPAVTYALVIIVLSSLVDCKEPAKRESRYLDAAREAGRWLQHVSDSVGWENVPDEISPASAQTPSIASGSPGRLLYYMEMYVATKDGVYLRSAEKEARLTVRLAGRASQTGLYDGMSGAAFAVTEYSKLVNDAALRNAASGLFLAAADTTLRRLQSGGLIPNDILNGSAGVGCALVYAWKEFRDSTILRAAIDIGESLLSVAHREGRNLWWSRWTGRELNLPNFSHGTAGITTFLAKLGEATLQERFINAARAGGSYILSISDTSDGLMLVPYGMPNEGYVTAYDVGWAHGPAGSSRTFLALARLTGEEAYQQYADRGVNSILASGVPGRSADTSRWNSLEKIDRRFGLASIVSFLADRHAYRPEGRILEKARECANAILGAARRDGHGIFWPMIRYGFIGPEEPTAYTGYFYGAAGYGLTFLDMHYAEAGGERMFRFPDEVF